jgi:uncharacterized membrane protein YqjE
MLERLGGPNKLLVMVLMVMLCLLFRWLAAMTATILLLISCGYRSKLTSLFGPPLGLVYSLVEILDEGGKERIGQNDRFAMV